MENKIIVIDGTSNAGKTTLCKMYSQTFENVGIIPGTTQFVKEHKELYPNGIPPIPKNKEEEIKNQKFFFDLELHRLIYANKMAKECKNVLMDRNVLEILAVAYSLEKDETYKGVYLNACNLYKEYVKCANENKIKLPDKYVILFASQNELEKRNLKRENTLANEWIEKSLIDRQKIFFDRFLKKHQEVSIKIDTDNKNEKEVLQKVEEILQMRKRRKR